MRLNETELRAGVRAVLPENEFETTFLADLIRLDAVQTMQPTTLSVAHIDAYRFRVVWTDSRGDGDYEARVTWVEVGVGDVADIIPAGIVIESGGAAGE